MPEGFADFKGIAVGDEIVWGGGCGGLVKTQHGDCTRNPFGIFLAPFGVLIDIEGYRWCSMRIDFSGESQQDRSGINCLSVPVRANFTRKPFVKRARGITGAAARSGECPISFLVTF